MRWRRVATAESVSSLDFPFHLLPVPLHLSLYSDHSIPTEFLHSPSLADNDDLLPLIEFPPHHPNAQLLPREILNELLILDGVPKRRLSE